MVNVFSFCLYGSTKKYLDGMIQNIECIRHYFPEFEIWIYLGSDVPAEKYSTYPNVKCIPTTITDSDLKSYRYFPIDDPSVECMIVRDTDSRVYDRDAWCIREFLRSDKKFHIVRDHYWHKTKITGGMWGVKQHFLNVHIEDLYKTWIRANPQYQGLYDTDQKFLEACIYERVKHDVLIHSNMVGHAGETIMPIPGSLQTEIDFVGNVYDFNEHGEFPVFRYSDFPLLDHIRWLCERDQWSLIISLVPFDKISSFSSRDTYALLDILYRAYYYTNDVVGAQTTLTLFEYTHVDEHIIKNSNYLFPKLGKKIVGTTNPNREPSDDEIVVVYGNYPHTYKNLPYSNKVYRHATYYSQIRHDVFECNTCWNAIRVIYILNLEERVDRWLDILIELCNMRAPLDRIYHYKAKKEVVKGDKTLDAYLGATKNHLDVVEHFRKNFSGQDMCLVLEDDFMFTSSREANTRNLHTFCERKYVFDVCLLSTSKYHTIKPHDDLLNRSYQECTTSSGYLLQRDTCEPVYECFKEGYETMLKTGDYHTYVCDRYWAKLQTRNRFFVFKEKMGFQRGNYSSINNRFTCHFD